VRESLLKKLENPRTRYASVLADENFTAQLLSNRSSYSDDRGRIQWEFARTGPDSVGAK
jgi:hypothetical protein